jgi:putative transposase
MKGDIYHIVNRGVEKRKIFLGDRDYIRFIDGLHDFNSKNPVPMSYKDRRSFNNLAMQRPSDGLVDILACCLMPNHYHLLVREKVDGGAGAFSKKVSGGYTQYFNLKNNRSGFLFQGRTKIVPIKKEAHFIHIPYYIFSNPIKLAESCWKEKGIENMKKILEFLKNYKWSSFNGTILRNDTIFSDVVNSEAFLKLFNVKPKEFEKYFIEWLREQNKRISFA